MVQWRVSETRGPVVFFPRDWRRSFARPRAAPAIRRVDDGAFGMLPRFAKKIATGMRNALARVACPEWLFG